MCTTLFVKEENGKASRMRGQKLHVRRVIPSDATALASFHATGQFGYPLPHGSEGILGKIVGEVVAHLLFERTGGEATIRHLLVATEMRKKRVGTLMVRELEQILSAEGVSRIGITADCPLRSFFLKQGFVESGTGTVLEKSLGMRAG